MLLLDIFIEKITGDHYYSLCNGERYNLFISGIVRKTFDKNHNLPIYKKDDRIESYIV